MCDADLNQKIWGLKALTHFFVAAGVRAGISFLYLLAVFDYAGLSEEEKDKVRETFWESYMNPFMLNFLFAGFILSWLLCPSRCWYGILSALQFLFALWCFLNTTIVLKNYIASRNEDSYEYFKFGLFGYFSFGYLTGISAIYIGLFLMRVSCLSPPKQRDIYVVHVVHSTAKDHTSSSSEMKTEEIDSESQKSQSP